MDYDNDTDFNQSFFSYETKPECEEYDMHILHVSLLPAVFIILLLSLLERRKKVYDCERRLACLRGRFGVVVPVDFMSTLENRWSYAFAFGAVAQHMMCLILKLSNPLPIDLPDYLEVLKMMLAALMVGISCKPLFICLSTKHRLLGSVLGLLYSIFWFSMQLWELIWCSDSTAQKGGIKDYLWKNEWLLDLQLLLCLGFLVCRFGFLIVIEILIYLKKYNKRWFYVCLQDEVQKEYYKYVQRLLLRPAERSVEKSWFQRKVYEWDPYFKFPNRIIATVVLSFFTLYLMIIFEQAVSPQFFVDLFILYDEYLQDFISELDFTEYINYIKYAWYVSAACAALMSVICVSRVLVCYRKHIKSMWAGEKKYLPRKYKLNPTDSLGGLLEYPGFQIAFTLWGYVIIHLVMFVGILVLILVIMEVVVLPIKEFGFVSWLNDRTIFLVSFLVVLAVDRLQRMLIHMFFLQDKNSSMDKDKPLALNNRKVFHNVNYFLFFFNVIMGLLSCVMRLIRSTAVGLMLLTSIDRAIMPRGFEELDKSITETFLLTHYSLMKLMAKVSWVGMIIADHHHSNPVLLSFCHLLLTSAAQRVQVDERSYLISEPSMKKRARQHWFLIYTLVRNPKLILMRKQAKQNKQEAEFAFAWAVSNSSKVEDTKS